MEGAYEVHRSIEHRRTRLAQGFRFRVSSFGFRISVFEFRVSDFGFQVSGFGFRASGFGFRISGFEMNFGFQVSFEVEISGFGAPLSPRAASPLPPCAAVQGAGLRVEG